MQYFSKTIVTAIALLLTTFNGFAQQPENIYDIRFYALSWTRSIKGLHISQQGTDVPIFISSSAPSGPYRYTGPSPLRFYQVEMDADNLPVRTVKAEIPLSEDAPPELLLFLPDSNTEETAYSILPLQNVFTTSGNADELFAINFALTQIALSINEQIVQLGTQQSLRIKTVPDKNNNLRLRIAHPSAEGWALAYSTIWTPMPAVKDLIFVIPSDKEADTLRIRRYNIPLQITQ